MKTQLFAIFLFLFATLSLSASIQPRSTEITDVSFPADIKVFAETTASSHDSYTILEKGVKVASVDYNPETGLYEVHDADGAFVDPASLKKRAVEERAPVVPVIILVVLRIAIQRFGARVGVWAACIGARYIIPCAGVIVDCAGSGVAPWNCATAVACLTAQGVAWSAIGRC